MRKLFEKKALMAVLAVCFALRAVPAFAVDEDMAEIEAYSEGLETDEDIIDYLEEDQMVFDEIQDDYAFDDVLEDDTNAYDTLEGDDAFYTAESFIDEEDSEAVTEVDLLMDDTNDFYEVADETETVFAAENYGTCGENLTWTLNDAGVLTISGTGDMENYWNSDRYGCNSPFYNQKTEIKTVFLENGVTSKTLLKFLCK